MFRDVKEKRLIPDLHGIEGYEQRSIFYNRIFPRIGVIVSRDSAGGAGYVRELLTGLIILRLQNR